MFDFKKEITELFIQTPNLFTDYNYNAQEYFEHFFPKGSFTFRIPYLLTSKDFLAEFKDRIVQTNQFVGDGQLITVIIIQISPSEHFTVSYTAEFDKIASIVTLHLENPTRVPFWLETLKKFESKEDQKKVLGFAGFQ